MKVSFLLPTKRRHVLLSRALKNLADVKKQGDQVVCVVNDETEESWAVAEASGVVDVLMRSRGANAMEALLNGFSAVTGDYLMCLADDDALIPRGCMEAREVLARHPEIDFLRCGGYIVYLRERVKLPICIPKGTGYATEARHIAEYWAGGLGNLYRTEMVRDLNLLGPYATSLFLDTRMGYAAVRGGATVKFLRLPTYYHVSNPDGVDKKAYAEDQEGAMAIHRAMKAEFGVRGVKPKKYEYPPIWDGEFA